MALIARTLAFALLALGLALQARAQHGEQRMHQRFDEAEKWARVFDDPARDAWQKPAEVIRALGLAPEARVADLGAGTGYFAVRLARAVPQGHVYGVDLEPDMVRYLNERAARERLANLSAHLASEDDPRLAEPVDLVLVVDTYHHIAQRPRYFERLKGSLRPGGRVAVIDFRLDSPTGPPRRHRIEPAKVQAEMERAGYRLAAAHGFLPNQYFLVFAPR
jgi:cyclopropane fatty-acyl-phospholipid synthase-like methyltransferase